MISNFHKRSVASQTIVILMIADFENSTSHKSFTISIDIFGTNGYLIRLNIYTPEASFEYPIS